MPNILKALQAAAGNGPSLAVDDVFSVSLYTGNGSTQSITNGIDVSGEGGLVWVKRRDGAGDHQLFDTERGAGYRLRSNSNLAESYNINTLSSFNSDGFSVGAVDINDSGHSLSSWTFRKAPKFFDVVTYTGDGVAGRTVSHSLGSTPAVIIVKRLTGLNDWFVYHSSLGATKAIKLNKTDDANTNTVYWNDTAPTDSVFSVGTDAGVNTNTVPYVAYLFASDAGGFGDGGSESIIKCGSYTGNGSNQTIDCGFSAGAKLVVVKRTNSAGDWYVWDSERGVVAGNDPHLSLNTATAEVTTDDSIDPDSSGFIVNQVAATNINVSSSSYIYIAIG